MSDLENASPCFLSGGGALGALTRAHDWSSHPLGDPSEWPAPLQTFVSLLLHSETPMFVAWGPEFHVLYNDAYSRTLGKKHPTALGRRLPDIWPEIWDVVAPLVRRTLAGETVRMENKALRLFRNGFEEQAWFTFEYSPILDADGRVAGLYCSSSETTARILMDRSREEETRRLYCLFEKSPGFMALLLGPDHAFELANRAFMELVGCRDLIGRTFREVFPDLADQGYFELLDRVYLTGEPFVGRRSPVSLRRMPCESTEQRYLDFVFQPIIGADAEIIGVFIEGYDVTDHQRTEDELRQSEQRALEGARSTEIERRRLHALLQAAPVGIVYADCRGKLILCNAENAEIWGNHPLSDGVSEYGEWRGWWADRSHRHGQRIASEEWGLARALRGEEVVRDMVEIEPFGQPGVRRTLVLKATPVRNADDQIIGGVVAQMDISHAVKAEAALRESEAKFRTIANAMPQMIWSTLPDGRNDYANRQWYEFTGTVEGSCFDDGWKAVIHAEDLQPVMAAWERCLKTLEPFDYEYRVRHHSGHYRWVLARAVPVWEDDNQVLRWMGTCTDVHEQKLAQEALRDSEERFRTLADNIPQLAWMADRTGWIFWFNNRWFDYTGTTPTDTLGWGWTATHHPDYVDSVTEKYRRHVEAGLTWEDTYPVKGRDGTYRWFLSRAVPIRDAAGNVLHWFGTNTDVTSQREAEEALRRTDQRKDEFLAMLAHELRNPLAPIMAAADLLSLGRLDEDRVRHLSGVVARQAAHMTSLIDDLLDVSRVTRGLVTLDKAPVDLCNVVLEAMEQVRPLCDARGHEMRAPPLPHGATVLGDRKRLVQVLANLLSNAAKYTPNGGCIEVCIDVRANGIVVAVRDNGIGMERDLVACAFDLFTQGERTADRSQGGLGIGLALVRSLVQLHGGTVGASSRGLGHGSEFSVTLPRYAADEAMRFPGENLPATPPTGTALRVVVVDDNVDAAQLLGMCLEQAGHEVIIEYSSTTALECIAAVEPDVCLLDIGLPDVDGNELARRLRAMPALSGTVLVAVTGYGRTQDREAAHAAGFNHHFVKPIDTRKLIAWLARLKADVRPTCC